MNRCLEMALLVRRTKKHSSQSIFGLDRKSQIILLMQVGEAVPLRHHVCCTADKKNVGATLNVPSPYQTLLFARYFKHCSVQKWWYGRSPRRGHTTTTARPCQFAATLHLSLLHQGILVWEEGLRRWRWIVRW